MVSKLRTLSPGGKRGIFSNKKKETSPPEKKYAPATAKN
jgi:hypothetical protein